MFRAVKTKAHDCESLAEKTKNLDFDDSTSAVDTKTEALIRDALKNELADVTKIIIAQRISSVENADKVIVLMKVKSTVSVHLKNS